jgi:hypothetical protein
VQLNPSTFFGLKNNLTQEDGAKQGDYMIERGEYKGKPLIIIKRSEDDKYPFSFGVSKAKLILDNLEEIKKFVEENSRE